MQVISSVVQFHYTIQADCIQITHSPFNQTLLEYKEKNKMFVLLEAIQIFIECTQAAFQFATHKLCFGGYGINDFVIKKVNKKFKVKVKINIFRILKVLSDDRNYGIWDPPELRLGQVTEKADFWTLARIFCKMVAEDYLHLEEKSKNMTQVEFLQSLNIQSRLIVETLAMAFKTNPEERIGYLEFFSINQQKMNPMLKYFKSLPNSISNSIGEYFKRRRLSNYVLIGQGSYGTIYRVTNEGGQNFVIKGIRVENQKQMNIAYSEVMCLFSFGASNYVVKIENVQKVIICGFTYIILMQDHAYYGDLRKFLRLFQPQLNQQQILKIFYNVTKALYNLKLKGVVHRDVKPDNVFIHSDFHAQLGDFGSNELVIEGQVSSRFAGTIGYIAPEVLNGAKVSFPIDVWSVGIMLREYIQNCPIIEQCLVEDPAKRISIERLTYYLSRYQNVTIEVDDSKVRDQIESGQTSEVTSNTLQNSYIEIQAGFSFCNIASLKW
eukprot:EST48833.1 Kinase, ULK [Spironucleus salmonicida]